MKDPWKATKNRVSGWWSIIVAMPVHMRLLGVVFIVLSAIFFAVMFSESTEKCIADLLGLKEKFEILKFLGIGMGGILLVVQAVTSYRRAKAMEDAAKAQANAADAQAKATEQQAKANQNTEEGQRQERLKNAIEHLGHPSDSVRLGGAYELFHLAKDTEELCQTVLDILCAHIRRTTGESKYREEHKSKPSEEVQSLLTLMFVEEHAVFKGCGINLQGSWLNGANLERARLQGANLVEAQLQGVESSLLESSEPFEDRIRRLIGQESDLSGVVFGGGLSRQDIDSLVEGLSDEKAKDLRVKLEPHIDKPSSYELPEDSGAVTGVYTKEEAERWIAEYKQAMSKVPGRDDG